MQRKFSDLEQDPVAAAHARGDSSDPSEQSETLSQTELHKMQRELSHRYLEENKKIVYQNSFNYLLRRLQKRTFCETALNYSLWVINFVKSLHE